MFHALDDINWTRVVLIMGAVTAIWLGLDTVVPEPYHDKIGLVLAAISGGIGVMTKGGKS
jgi:hypothetical protein